MRRFDDLFQRRLTDLNLHKPVCAAAPRFPDKLNKK